MGNGKNLPLETGDDLVLAEWRECLRCSDFKCPAPLHQICFAFAGDDEPFVPEGIYGAGVPSRQPSVAPSMGRHTSTPPPAEIDNPVKGQMEELAAMVQSLQRQAHAAQSEVPLPLSYGGPPGHRITPELSLRPWFAEQSFTSTRTNSVKTVFRTAEGNDTVFCLETPV